MNSPQPKFHELLKIPYYTEQDLSLFKDKAIPVQPAASGEETAIYRSILSPNELLKDFPEIKTVYDLFNFSVKNYGQNKMLGTRYPSRQRDGTVAYSGYEFRTYTQVNQDRLNFGAGLMHLYDHHVIDKVAKWFMGVFSVNRYEWLVADLGATCYSIANVALYDTLGPETSEFIINHAEVPVIVTSVDKVAGLLSMSKKCPTLKVIIVMDTLFKNEESAVPILEKWGAQLGIKVISFSETLELGKKHPRDHNPPSSDDLYALSYTSGTTGNPKGVMLTHLNMVSTLRTMATTLVLGPDDAHISYLPLAHIFERVIILGVILNGCSAGFFRGDVALLLEDIAELKPTIFASVPRLFNRIYDKIVQGALHSGSAVKAALFSKALDAKMHYLNTQGTLNHSIWDPLVFNKVKKVLGGRVRYMITASAPISSNVLTFLRVAASSQVCEAYGQTESCGGLTISWPNDFTQGHVGYVVPHQELKLVSVPDMNYHAKDLKGEVWVRGYGVFKGYLKDKAKTDETLTQDGWLKTGDIGTLDKAGRLSIVDRKKNIFKLAQGEYVAPEKLENVFLKSPFVAQIFVTGISTESELVAIIVPDQEYSLSWAVSNGVLPANTVLPPPPPANAPLHPLVRTIANSEKFKKAVLKNITAVGKSEKLRGFEFVKAIFLHPELFNAESGLLTPTFKLKRAEADKLFRPQIEEMYRGLAKNKPAAKL